MKTKTLFARQMVFALLLGTSLHFTYDIFGQNKLVALFSAINESSWEHLKLVFIPFLLLTFYDIFAFKEQRGKAVFGKALASLGGCLMVLIFFYTYSGIIGKNFLFMDILTFVLGILTGFWLNYAIIAERIKSPRHKGIYGTIIFLTLTLCFIVFTFLPPQINLFLDPVTHTYGI